MLKVKITVGYLSKMREDFFFIIFYSETSCPVPNSLNQKLTSRTAWAVSLSSEKTEYVEVWFPISVNYGIIIVSSCWEAE